MTRRMLSVWLPHWPVTRLSRRHPVAPDSPLVTVEAMRGVRRLAAVGADGAARGLHPGQTLTDARAICPALTPADADPAADEATLVAVAAWAERYTPLSAADPPDGLWLDIAGCVAAAFADEAALLRDLAHRLERTGIHPCRLAVAGTTGAAWALSHAQTRDAITVLPAGQEAAALASLPVAGLRLEPRIVAGLRRLGLRTIGQLRRIPRAELTARFGAAPVQRLDQALGAAVEAIAWPHPPAAWFERLAFAEPIGTPDDLGGGLALLAERLCARLEAREQGAQLFTARFFRVDDTAVEIAAATGRPVRDAAYLTRLLREKLETIDPSFGIEVMTLEAEHAAALPATQDRMLGAAADANDGLTEVVDTLANRIGPARLWRVAPRESHVPERAVQRVPPMTAARPRWTWDPEAPRPIRLLRRPEPIEATAALPDDPPVLFRWRGALHRVRVAAGPERIAAEWWRRDPADAMPARAESDRVRDYFRVEDTEGARFWLFRAGLHGQPRWFLHGLFA